MSNATAICDLCGEPMPPGEQMFKYHGYSGPCPKPPLPKADQPDGTGKVDDDSLADMAAVELLKVLETPINGVPAVEFRNYDNARRLVKAALLAVFEAKP